MHIGRSPAVAGVTAGTTSNGAILGSNIEVRVRRNLHIDVQNASSFGTGATYYVIGDVVSARTIARSRSVFTSSETCAKAPQ
jgi:hypothetical protein